MIAFNQYTAMHTASLALLITYQPNSETPIFSTQEWMGSHIGTTAQTGTAYKTILHHHHAILSVGILGKKRKWIP